MQKDVCVLTAAAVKDKRADMGKSISLALQMPRIKRDLLIRKENGAVCYRFLSYVLCVNPHITEPMCLFCSEPSPRKPDFCLVLHGLGIRAEFGKQHQADRVSKAQGALHSLRFKAVKTRASPHRVLRT